MRKQLTRENIVGALIVAVYDQSQTHDRDDENVIRRFLAEIDRASWIGPAIADYRAACGIVEGSGTAEVNGGVCDECGGYLYVGEYGSLGMCPACNGTGRKGGPNA